MQGLKAIREAKLQEAKRYTQEAVAKAVGVTPPTIAAYEKDPGRINRAMAEALAEYLGCNVEDIFLPCNPK